ncbi:MAG: hypothetical protein EZS28_008400 [Streblomastix strix]|uniref:UBX domain-containing protein n=1 Tax=Streblomastix strix TaxID=222440 RepID=A0A5J4WLW8_9EUKA|nr:MAG: hypothetical protein EZS28_008400 [Streblomastix strix]
MSRSGKPFNFNNFGKGQTLNSGPQVTPSPASSTKQKTGLGKPGNKQSVRAKIAQEVTVALQIDTKRFIKIFNPRESLWQILRAFELEQEQPGKEKINLTRILEKEHIPTHEGQEGGETKSMRRRKKHKRKHNNQGQIQNEEKQQEDNDIDDDEQVDGDDADKNIQSKSQSPPSPDKEQNQLVTSDQVPSQPNEQLPIPPPRQFYCEPSVLYIRQIIKGIQQLSQSTLISLGITSGQAMLRFSSQKTDRLWDDQIQQEIIEADNKKLEEEKIKENNESQQQEDIKGQEIVKDDVNKQQTPQISKQSSTMVPVSEIQQSSMVPVSEIQQSSMVPLTEQQQSSSYDPYADIIIHHEPYSWKQTIFSDDEKEKDSSEEEEEQQQKKKKKKKQDQTEKDKEQDDQIEGSLQLKKKKKKKMLKDEEQESSESDGKIDERFFKPAIFSFTEHGLVEKRFNDISEVFKEIRDTQEKVQKEQTQPKPPSKRMLDTIQSQDHLREIFFPPQRTAQMLSDETNELPDSFFSPTQNEMRAIYESVKIQQLNNQSQQVDAVRQQLMQQKLYEQGQSSSSSSQSKQSSSQNIDIMAQFKEMKQQRIKELKEERAAKVVSENDGVSRIRIKFQDGYSMEGHFVASTHKVSDLIQFVRETLKDKDIPFVLTTTPPPKKHTNEQFTLLKSGLYPSALIHLSIDMEKADKQYDLQRILKEEEEQKKKEEEQKKELIKDKDENIDNELIGVKEGIQMIKDPEDIINQQQSQQQQQYQPSIPSIQSRTTTNPLQIKLLKKLILSDEYKSKAIPDFSDAGINLDESRALAQRLQQEQDRAREARQRQGNQQGQRRHRRGYDMDANEDDSEEEQDDDEDDDEYRESRHRQRNAGANPNPKGKKKGDVPRWLKMG